MLNNIMRLKGRSNNGQQVVHKYWHDIMTLAISLLNIIAPGTLKF